MPELIEQMYCSQQIVIPPKFPYILKRYCKAAIKTQPYDLLRWSFEYFKALSEHRPPPVKLRLEYPVYSTEGGLTRGCLKVLAHQLYGMKEIPIDVLKQAWQGFCLDPIELKRILCLCEVYLRAESVPFFHFLSVAGGMLTKCLTHTMILLCESLTKEPDGGSAAIPVNDFLTMYRYLAKMDASRDVKYHDGFREGQLPEAEATEEEASQMSDQDKSEGAGGRPERLFDMGSEDEEYWEGSELQRLALIDDNVARSARISVKMNLPPIGKIERSPSIERIREIERDNYMRERTGRAVPNEEIDKKLKQLSTLKLGQEPPKDVQSQGTKETEAKVVKKEVIDIYVYDEDENAVKYEIYGEQKEDYEDTLESENADHPDADHSQDPEHVAREKLALFLANIFQDREERLNYLEQLFDEIAHLVDKFKTANYDLGMVAGRQMSTTSGEFIVQNIEKEIMAYIDDQIAILPDPDLKKKKAKPEEVAMVRDIVEQWLDDNIDIIVPDIEEVEEEEAPIPEITMVYAVPGIGGPVDQDIINDFEEYSREVSRIQADLMMPRNIRHFLCPPLEKYIEHNYATYEQPNVKKEEVPTEGAITE